MDEHFDFAIINKFKQDSDFYDQHEIEYDYGSLSALDTYIALASLTPKWVNVSIPKL